MARANDAAGGVEWLPLGRLRGRRRPALRRDRREPALPLGRPTWRPPRRSLRFEPAGALVAGPSGLEAIARIAAEAPGASGARRLAADRGRRRPGGPWPGSGAAGLGTWTRREDLAGIARVVGGAGLSDDVAAPAPALRAGGVALVPTDTVYGLAAALDVAGRGRGALRAQGAPARAALPGAAARPAALDEALAPLDARTAAAARRCCRAPRPAWCPIPPGRYRAAGGARAGRRSGPRAADGPAADRAGPAAGGDERQRPRRPGAGRRWTRSRSASAARGLRGRRRPAARTASAVVDLARSRPAARRGYSARGTTSRTFSSAWRRSACRWRPARSDGRGLSSRRQAPSAARRAAACTGSPRVGWM